MSLRNRAIDPEGCYFDSSPSLSQENSAVKDSHSRKL